MDRGLGGLPARGACQESERTKHSAAYHSHRTPNPHRLAHSTPLAWPHLTPPLLPSPLGRNARYRGILKEPVGCTFSYLRKTGMPPPGASAQLSSRGVTTWKGSPCTLQGALHLATTWRAWAGGRSRHSPGGFRVPRTGTGEGEGEAPGLAPFIPGGCQL